MSTPPPGVTRSLTLKEYFASETLADTVLLSREGMYPFGIVRGTLEAAGIAIEDLMAVRHGSGLPDVEDDRSMYLNLLNYFKACPDLTLRSAVGGTWPIGP